MRAIELSSGVAMRPFRAGEGPAILTAVDADREHLAPWMPWVPHATEVASFTEFIDGARRQEADGTAFQRGLFDGDRVIGGVGATVDLVNLEADVGYWIASEHQGRGIMTEAVEALLEFLFDRYEVHRSVIRAAADNERSRVLAERLGFTLEGVLRESLVLEGLSKDAVVYSLLAPEWRERKRPGRA